jgi:hypothetical protein
MSIRNDDVTVTFPVEYDTMKCSIVQLLIYCTQQIDVEYRSMQQSNHRDIRVVVFSHHRLFSEYLKLSNELNDQK